MLKKKPASKLTIYDLLLIRLNDTSQDFFLNQSNFFLANHIRDLATKTP